MHDPSTDNMIRRWRQRLSTPTDNASLAFIRIYTGVIMIVLVVFHLTPDVVRGAWIDPDFHFTFPGFHWVSPWPGDGIHLHVIAIGVLGALVAIGLLYRLAAALLFLAFTYLFLLEQAEYQNHMYLLCMVLAWLAIMPANRCAALDTRLRLARPASTTPFWTVWMLRFLVALPYTFGGLAKLNGDWLACEPMRTWLPGEEHLLGSFAHTEAAAILFSYGGILFDLLIVPALLYRRTRTTAFCIAVLFHLSNHLMFEIDIFPWFMIGATTVFLAPSWPRTVRTRRVDPASIALPTTPAAPSTDPVPTRPLSLPLTGLIATFVVIQLVLPFRHLLYPGNVDWTEEGHRFAWRMMIADKPAIATFTVSQPTDTITIYPEDVLSPRQAATMVRKPDMILAFAHELSRRYAIDGQPADVRATVNASLNGRPLEPLVQSTDPLSDERWSLRPWPWIHALDMPLRPTREYELERFAQQAPLGLWTLHASGTFATPPSESGRRALGFWSDRAGAELYHQRLANPQQVEILEISLDQFNEFWVDRLTQMDVAMGINWRGSPARGYAAEPSEILTLIQRMGQDRDSD